MAATSNPVMDRLSLDCPVLRAYLFYSALLVLKMLAMSMLTAKQRFKNGVFANPEDTKTLPKSKVRYDHQDVERVRRGHLNDLENITPFFIIAFLYLLTGPSSFIAINLFRAFTVARFLHTIVYTVVVIPQPARVLAFAVGYVITAYMAIQVILSVL